MSAVQTTVVVSPMPSAAPSRAIGIAFLRVLLLIEAALGVAIAIALSMLAGGANDGSGAGITAEENLRFAAGFAFMSAILAAVAARGARRRRAWSWTLAAVLQLLAALGTGAALTIGSWHPAYLLGFAASAVMMLVLSTGPVRRGLGQE